MKRRVDWDAFDPDSLPSIELFEDARHGIDELASPNQYRRRSAVRALVVAVEASIQRRRAWLLRAPDMLMVAKLTPLEQLVLREEQCQLGSDGGARLIPKAYPLPDTIRLIFAIYHRLFPKLPHVDWSSTEWNACRELIGLRNRLTHPRVAGDEVVTDSMACHAATGFLWYIKMEQPLLDVHAANVRRLLHPESTAT